MPVLTINDSFNLAMVQMSSMQFLAAVNSSRRQQLQQRKVELMQEFQRAAGDVGSPEVQSERRFVSMEASEGEALMLLSS